MRRLGRYELLCPIASGGMAEIYAARISSEGGFQKLIAIKSMLPHLARDEEFVSMFLDEGRIVANISSPHVIETYDLCRADDGVLYIAMELVIGASLRQMLIETRKRGESVPLPILAEILAQAAEGLHDVHRATTPAGEPLHIIHRDVSPHNILVGIDGRARISDFGIARAISRLSNTQTGHFKGKWSYVSPEQARGEPLDGRSDVFSLGIVAWEMATRERLFWRKNSYEIAMLNAVQFASIKPLTEFGLPLGFAKAVARALDRDLNGRTQTALELAAELREAAFEFTHELPSNEEVGAYVRQCCGPAIEALETKIRAAQAAEKIASEDIVPITVEGLLADPSPTVVLAKKGDEREREEPKRSRRLPLPRIAALAFLAMGVIGGFALFSSARSAPEATGPVPFPPPRAAIERPAIVDEPIEAPKVAEVVEVAEKISVDRPRADSKPRRALKRKVKAPARREVPPLAVAAPRVEERPRTEETPPAEGKKPSSPSRENGLFGIDSFDRELEKRKKKTAR